MNPKHKNKTTSKHITVLKISNKGGNFKAARGEDKRYVMYWEKNKDDGNFLTGNKVNKKMVSNIFKVVKEKTIILEFYMQQKYSKHSYHSQSFTLASL